jgi:hypothetical protein
MSVASFKGKLLEDVLAFLVRNSGYRLLVDPVQDPDELQQRGNGLVVRGSDFSQSTSCLMKTEESASPQILSVGSCRK